MFYAHLGHLSIKLVRCILRVDNLHGGWSTCCSNSVEQDQVYTHNNAVQWLYPLENGMPHVGSKPARLWVSWHGFRIYTRNEPNHIIMKKPTFLLRNCMLGGGILLGIFMVQAANAHKTTTPPIIEMLVDTVPGTPVTPTPVTPSTPTKPGMPTVPVPSPSNPSPTTPVLPAPGTPSPTSPLNPGVPAPTSPSPAQPVPGTPVPPPTTPTTPTTPATPVRP